MRASGTTQVGPGVFHQKIIAAEKPWELDVLEIDLTNPFIRIESAKARDLLKGKETSSSMSHRENQQDHWVVGAINADFFDGDGVPTNSQVINGELLKKEFIQESDPKFWSTVGFDSAGRPAIAVNQFQCQLFTETGDWFIDNVNGVRAQDHLVLYNRFMGAETNTNIYGIEALVRPLNRWFVNDTLSCVVKDVVSGQGNMAIPDGSAVLSGHGTSAQFLNNHTAAGDTIKLYLGLTGMLPQLKELVGGFPRIIKNGENYALTGYEQEGGSSTFHTDRHPRTAAGFSADSSTFYFVTVDGRQEHSIGMNLIELADFMIGLGVSDALNLDGGGSTTMVVRNSVKNSPSDGSERSVANALFTVSAAPRSMLSHIQIEPDNIQLRFNDQIQLKTSGWDEYYNPVSLTPSMIQFEVDGSLGKITDRGQFKVTTNGGQGWIYTHYEDKVDSAFLDINEIAHISLMPQIGVTDTVNTVQFKVDAADEHGVQQDLPASRFTWRSTEPEIGTIDGNGLFRGHDAGTTEIIVQYADLADTAEISVQIAANSVLLDSLDNLNRWNMTGSFIDTTTTMITVIDTPRTYGEKAVKLDYQFTRLATERSWIYLNSDIPIFGVPDKIELDVKSDGSNHKLYLIVSDDNGELFQVATVGYVKKTSYETVTFYSAGFRPISEGDFYYPIRIKGIHIKLGTNADYDQLNSGTIYLDHLRLIYPLLTDIRDEGNASTINGFRLFQNYPNPFNPVTRIRYDLPIEQQVELTIYNALGQQVRSLVNKVQSAGQYSVIFRASHLASGYYTYRLKTGQIVLDKSMILLK